MIVGEYDRIAFMPVSWTLQESRHDTTNSERYAGLLTRLKKDTLSVLDEDEDDWEEEEEDNEEEEMEEEEDEPDFLRFLPVAPSPSPSPSSLELSSLLSAELEDEEEDEEERSDTSPSSEMDTKGTVSVLCRLLCCSFSTHP